MFTHNYDARNRNTLINGIFSLINLSEKKSENSPKFLKLKRNNVNRPANRPAFGGTVPLFYQMSC